MVLVFVYTLMKDEPVFHVQDRRMVHKRSSVFFHDVYIYIYIYMYIDTIEIDHVSSVPLVVSIIYCDIDR